MAPEGRTAAWAGETARMENRGRASFEPLLNERLSSLLTGLGLVAEPEVSQAGSSKQIDVRVEVGRLIVAVEAEVDSRSGALSDSQARLDQAEAGEVAVDVAVAVSYPPGLQRDAFVEATPFEWTVLPSEEFTKGTVAELVASLKRIPEDYGDPEEQARLLDQALDLAAERLSAAQTRELAKAMDLPEGAAAAKRALLVVAAAAMFHTRLDAYLPEARPQLDGRTITPENPVGDPFAGDWPPAKLQDCVTADDVVGSLYEAWQLILAVDYRPIFEAACRALHAPTQDAAWDRSVRAVTGVALRVSRSAASARHDLLGRIFHRLLNTARYDGSFYTSTSAAVLLAGLAIGEDDLPEDLTNLKIVDPACGTGTLLMAAAERIRDLRDPEPNRQQTDAAALIEETLWGLDVNVTACHMAATTLGLLSPSVAFRHMNIHLMPLEVIDLGVRKETLVGSLELLDVGSIEEALDPRSGRNSRASRPASRRFGQEASR